MAPTSRPSSGYLPTLDGWRAVAIALVFCNHAPAWPSHFSLLQVYGGLGVDLFFALSGLLICTRLLEEERAFGSISLRGFYARRLFRIQPAAFFYLFALAVLALVHIVPMDWPAWWSAVTLWRNYFTAFVRDTGRNRFTGHFWSLAIEEHFYLLVPCILVFFTKWRRAILAWLTLGAFGWLALYIAAVPEAQRSIYWDRRTDLRIAGLLFPAWLALQYALPAGRRRLQRLLHPVLLPALGALGLAAYLLYHLWYSARTAASAVPAVAAQPGGIDGFAPHGGPASILQFVVPLAFPFLVLATLINATTWYGRILEWEPLRFVGRISYSLYLWQQLFWVRPYKGWPIARVEYPWIGSMLLSIAVAIFSFYCVERPMIRLGHRYFPPPSPGHRDTADTASRTLVSQSET